jgi:hypothetical protein
MDIHNVKNDFSMWFHSKSPMTYKAWYTTNLIKKLDEIGDSYYDSFNDKLFDIDPDNIPDKINNIKNNIANRYNVQKISFAEYDRKNRNGKPKSLLNNFYTKYLSEKYGGGENVETKPEDE